MATDLYNRMLAFNHEDPELAALMKKVWIDTPWMINAYTGDRREDRREHDMLEWCYEQFGPMASPIHDKLGSWQRGCATVFGWAWFGFATREDMDRFIARWPLPEGVPPQDSGCGVAPEADARWRRENHFP